MARITLDTDGLRDVLKTEDMKRLVNEAAEKIADNVKQLDIRVEGVPGDIDLPVKVTPAVSDRARATVSIAHPSGLAVQAKHGALTKAAAQAGLEVRSR